MAVLRLKLLFLHIICISPTIFIFIMDIAETTKIRNEINNHLAGRHLSKALMQLKQLVEQSGQWVFDDELKQLTTSYGLMLQYLSQGVLDPAREDILSQIIADSYTLTDKVYISLQAEQSTHIFYVRHRAGSTVSLQALINEFKVERNKLSLISSVDDENRDMTAFRTILQRAERLESDIFNYVWSSFPLKGSDASLITALIQDSECPNHLKSLILSALMLGITKFFDEAKLKLLLNCYTALSDTELKLRALINAVIAMYLYRDRLQFYKGIKITFDTVEKDANFDSDLRLIFTRLIHSRNTDNISRRMREDLMPELNKMSPDLFNKIKGKTPGTIDINEIEENPQWQQWLDESGITRKLEEFNEIQMQGGDVFISTFSKLKSYPFFNTLSNWFLPYHDQCSAVLSAFGAKSHPLTALFKVMPILCDSDKYSMLLSIATAPEAQRQMMFSQFDAQREQFKELQNEEAESMIKLRDNIVNRYIQDLYRFFKLYSRRREFLSIFDTDINLMEVEWLKPHLGDSETISIISEFYFKNGFYADAIKFYRYMLGNHDASPHVYQKIGFAYQSLEKFREALKNYSRYEIADGSDVWNLKQMAHCYRSLRDHDKAIEYYERAMDLSPDSVQLCLSLGHCYLDIADYDNALKQYYKADFMPKAKHRAWRPIAWCSFVTGKHEQSVNYYEKIIKEDSPTSQDHLNYGHLLQVMGKIGDAIAQYRLSLKLEKDDDEAFSRLYIADYKYLKTQGITYSDYALVLDAVINNSNI